MVFHTICICIESIEIERVASQGKHFFKFCTPYFIVQQGMFSNSVLILKTVSSFYGNRKFIHILGCLTLLIGDYFFDSYLHVYSNELLNLLSQLNETTTCEENSIQCIDPDVIPLEGKNYVIHPPLDFLYLHITVSRVNFNSVVANMYENTNGLWQARPFNFVLRNAQLDILVEFVEKTPRN